MDAHAFTLFDTALGRCGIVWSERGIRGLQLPEASVAGTRARLLRDHPAAQAEAPPAAVQQAVDDVVRLLRGEAVDLRPIELDFDGIAPFQRRVFELARGIGPGHTLSYGELAERLGEPGAARAVGHALGLNPFAIIVPCHRVLAAGGRIGGFSAGGGAATKRRLLLLERARIGNEPGLFDDPAGTDSGGRGDHRGEGPSA